MIKYIGSKRLLIPPISRIVQAVPDVGAVVDFFSGTARVGHALKRLGYRVIANDHLAYAHVLARCYVAADLEHVGARAKHLVERLNQVAAAADTNRRGGHFTETYCRRSRFFRPENGIRIEAVREAIQDLGVGAPSAPTAADTSPAPAAADTSPAPAAAGSSSDPEAGSGRHLAAVLLVSLMEAADRVDSTTGVQMAYLKSWAPRALKPLVLRTPDVLPASPAGPCEAHALDAADAADRLTGDLAYIDPPYNQHSYLGNYHIWETLVRWDAPEVYGVACKRIDCRTRKSDFNSRVRARNALADFVRRVRCPHLLVSFNDEGHVTREELEEMLGERGEVATLEIDHRRYVGARIGIHDRRGRKVGKVGRLRNREHLFLASPTGLDAAVEKVRRMNRDERVRAS